MAKENIKNLNVTNLKKEVKKLSAQTEHVIKIATNVKNEDGETVLEVNEYKIKIDDVFRKTKQHNLLDDLVKYFDEANNNIELIDLTTTYTTLLFIKHFTSVEISDNIDEALEVMQVLIDLELLGEILNLMPDEEVIKVYELLANVVNNMKENMEMTAEEAEKYVSLVENKELKDVLEQNGKE